MPTGTLSIRKLLQVLVKAEGSDLHLSVGQPGIVRVRGEMRRINMPPLTAEDMESIIRDVTLDEHRRGLVEELDVDLAYQCDLGRFRVNIFTQRLGLAAVFRAVSSRIPDPDDLGLPAAVRNLATQHKGLILVTGPTGSGKSTTLACLVDLINANRAAHIVTIEDPIEFVHESRRSLVSQREVGPHARSFARALRAALREDPDVILVGEMRDVETMSLAVTAAETGHLVLATLHTMSASKTIDRIVDSFPSEQQEQIRTQLAGSLLAVVAQMLVPRRVGKGRAAAFEVLLTNPAVANLIRENKTMQLRSTMQTHRQAGMQTMDHSLVELVKAGVVSAADALQVAQDRRGMERELAEAAEERARLTGRR